jgi:hypothetical protein
MDGNVVPSYDQNIGVDLYNQALKIWAYDYIYSNGMNSSCGIDNTCGDANGNNNHEFATYNYAKQNKFVYYYNLIISLQS